MTALLKRLWRWLAAQIVEPGPGHNHHEGAWRADCPNCGINGYRRWK